MAIRSVVDYMERVRKRKPAVYHLGKKVDNIVDYPMFKWPIKVISQICEWCLDPQYDGLLTTVSPVTGEKVDRYLHVFWSQDDLLARQRQIRFLMSHLGSCNIKCVGLGGINTMFSVTYDIDQECGTEYHQRFREFLKYVHQNDLFVAGAMMDVKGDRSKGPAQQADPDMYLHIIEERKDGIVVRGAKGHQTGTMFADEVLVMPCDVLRDEAERDYAVSFAIPTDAKGITYVMQNNLGDTMAYMAEENSCKMDMGNVNFGCQFGATALMIFDDVFVPNERIFMKGEWKFSEQLVGRMGTMARSWQVGCRPAIFDLITGATAALAEYNGIARKPHVIDKLTEMTYLTETVWGIALGAAVSGESTPSGAYLPNRMLTNVAKLQSTNAFYEIMKLAIDLTGGIIVSVPSELDIKNPETGKWIDKYLRGAPQFPTEHRLRAVRLIQALTQGPLAGALHHSGGPMTNQRLVIGRLSDMERKKRLAKMLAGIPVDEE